MKNLTEAEFSALAEVLRNAFEDVAVSEYPPDSAESAETDDGVRIDYGFTHGRASCNISRPVSVDGRTMIVSIRSPLAGGTLPEDKMDPREKELYREEMHHDFLTGVFNRRYLETVIRADAEKLAAEGRTAAAALIAIDNFYGILEKHGRGSADQLVCFAANQWKKTFFGTEDRVVCRVNGSSFMVYCRDMTADALRTELLSVYEEMPREYISTSAFPRRLPLTMSIGCADTGEEGCAEWKGLFEKADARVRGAENAL